LVWIQSEEFNLFSGSRDDVAEKISERIRVEYPDIDTAFLKDAEFVLEPTEKEIRNLFGVGLEFRKKVILSSNHPTDNGFTKLNPFTIIEIRGKDFPFTQEQLSLGLSKEAVLQEKLGLTIKKTNKTFADMAGASYLRKDVQDMLDLEELGMMSIAGLFLFGVAGAGKSYFAECFAGETGRHFVILDLPYFMTLPSPTKSVDEVFDFLESQDEKFLLLLDEIEKMFDFEGGNLIAKQVFGKLLTRLNDIYGNPKNNVTFVATANNITGIMKNSPEFLRKGRFNRLYFLGYPSAENAEEIFDLYKGLNKKKVKKALTMQYERYLEEKDAFDASSNENGEDERQKSYKLLFPYFREVEAGRYNIDDLVEFFTLDFNVSRNMRYIDSKFSSLKVGDSDKFIYSPPEIQAVSEEMQNKAMLEVLRKKLPPENLDKTDGIGVYENNDRFVLGIIEDIVPLQVSASEGVSRQVAQSKSYTGKEAGNVKQFVEA